MDDKWQMRSTQMAMQLSVLYTQVHNLSWAFDLEGRNCYVLDGSP